MRKPVDALTPPVSFHGGCTLTSVSNKAAVTFRARAFTKEPNGSGQTLGAL